MRYEGKVPDAKVMSDDETVMPDSDNETEMPAEQSNKTAYCNFNYEKNTLTPVKGGAQNGSKGMPQDKSNKRDRNVVFSPEEEDTNDETQLVGRQVRPRKVDLGHVHKEGSGQQAESSEFDQEPKDDSCHGQWKSGNIPDKSSQVGCASSVRFDTRDSLSDQSDVTQSQTLLPQITSGNTQTGISFYINTCF